MTHDSDFISNGDIKVNVSPSPRKATINFLQQFARTYAALPGIAFSAMSIN